jgi:hypothetical protein
MRCDEIERDSKRKRKRARKKPLTNPNLWHWYHTGIGALRKATGTSETVHSKPNATAKENISRTASKRVTGA